MAVAGTSPKVALVALSRVRAEVRSAGQLHMGGVGLDAPAARPARPGNWFPALIVG